jgi:hypothetical protein
MNFDERVVWNGTGLYKTRSETETTRSVLEHVMRLVLLQIESETMLTVHRVIQAGPCHVLTFMNAT